MPSNIVLCLDGTWNKPGQKDQGVETKTNVLKLYEALAVRPDQIREYFSGVGTAPTQKIRGGAFGWGLFDQIKDAYRCLRNHFMPGDRIYIFGFSRGAFSARSLAGMVLRCGVIRRDVEDVELPGLVADLLSTQQDDNLEVDVADKVFAMYKHAYDDRNLPEVERFKREYCHDSPVRLVGVWDTVGSLGIPDELVLPALRGVDRRIDAKLYGFLNTDLSPRVEAAYHAVAIDEHRKPFLPTLWTDPDDAAARVNRPGSNVEQVWFAGAHCNVGGGYTDSGLSDIALAWMADRASSNGLQFEVATLNTVRPDSRAKRRDSLEEFIEFGGRKMSGLFAWIDRLAVRYLAVDRDIIPGSCIHASVGDRLAAPAVCEPKSDAPYRPPATLKLTLSNGVRWVDRQFRLVS
jgi:uncharacterized protein (DUF2235 family)